VNSCYPPFLGRQPRNSKHLWTRLFRMRKISPAHHHQPGRFWAKILAGHSFQNNLAAAVSKNNTPPPSLLEPPVRYPCRCQQPNAVITPRRHPAAAQLKDHVAPSRGRTTAPPPRRRRRPLRAAAPSAPTPHGPNLVLPRLFIELPPPRNLLQFRWGSVSGPVKCGRSRRMLELRRDGRVPLVRVVPERTAR
jgi:hypothetical protein